MKFGTIFVVLASASIGLCANSFAGANNYYAYALPQTEQIELLQAMSDAGMKVHRYCADIQLDLIDYSVS